MGLIARIMCTRGANVEEDEMPKSKKMLKKMKRLNQRKYLIEEDDETPKTKASFHLKAK